MRVRGVAVGLAVLGLSLLPITPSAAAPPNQGSRVCAWGGTPAAPTGMITVSPGVTNFPSAGPCGSPPPGLSRAEVRAPGR